jgi:diadenosine tetraphosphate (Ap4A) HIT family hydrolase
MSECPFCARVTEGTALIHQGEVAVSFLDAFPVSEGHVLVVPRRHLARVEELGPDEWAGLFALVHRVSRELAGQPGVDGVNVGINSGVAAGQTVDHAHVHVIPRRLGDVPDPRGGVRHVIPSRAAYWSHA